MGILIWGPIAIALAILGIYICIKVMIIRAICNYLAKCIAAEMREQQNWHRRQESEYQESEYWEEAE